MKNNITKPSIHPDYGKYKGSLNLVDSHEKGYLTLTEETSYPLSERA